MPAWVRSTRARLEGGDEQEVCAIRARGEKRYLVAAQVQNLLREKLAEKASAQVSTEEHPTDKELEERAARTTLGFCRLNLGMKSVVWEPASSSVYILGRPVQVS